MASRAVKVFVAVALSGALIVPQVLVGCAANTAVPPTGPAAAPVNTSPEPLENPSIQDSPTEESGSVSATQAP